MPNQWKLQCSAPRRKLEELGIRKVGEHDYSHAHGAGALAGAHRSLDVEQPPLHPVAIGKKQRHKFPTSLPHCCSCTSGSSDDTCSSIIMAMRRSI